MLMPRRAPIPSVRLCQKSLAGEEKNMRHNMYKAHNMAVHSFLSSLHLSSRDRDVMKKIIEGKLK